MFGTRVALGSHDFKVHADGMFLRRPLRIFFRYNFRHDGSPLNLCLQSIVKQGVLPYPWAGDLLVLKFVGTRCEDYCDINDQDISALIYLLLSNDFGYGGSERPLPAS